jgi:hypothetical protein
MVIVPTSSSPLLRPPWARCQWIGERGEVALGRAGGESVRSVAARLGRSPSTVSRELRRNVESDRLREVLSVVAPPSLKVVEKSGGSYGNRRGGPPNGPVRASHNAPVGYRDVCPPTISPVALLWQSSATGVPGTDDRTPIIRPQAQDQRTSPQSAKPLSNHQPPEDQQINGLMNSRPACRIEAGALSPIDQRSRAVTALLGGSSRFQRGHVFHQLGKLLGRNCRQRLALGICCTSASYPE